MDPLEGVSTFVTVVDAQSFSGAAKTLRRSKAAVSLQIKKLEERLGVRLLNRTTRRLSLTNEGRSYVEHCRRILEEANEAEELLNSTKAAPKGLLRINAPMSFGIQHLGDAVADFMLRNPEVEVDLVLNDQVVDLLENGFDMAIRIANLPDSSLVARRLAPCRRIVAATPEYWNRHGRPSHPNDLKSHNVLLYDYLEERDAWMFKGNDGRQFKVQLTGNLRANNGDVMVAAVRKGLGVDMMPTFFCCDDLRNGRLEVVLQDFENDPISVYAVYPHRRHLSTKVRVFVDFLADRFKGRPYWDDWDK
ncbi:MAG: LysR family transcriptional regulator [Pseudomonadota bacterium]